MFRRLLWAATCAAFCLSLTATEVHAVFMTELGTIQAQDPDDGPPLTDIRRIDSSGGHVFTNQFTSPNGPFGVGAEIRTVVAIQMQSAIDGELFQPLQDGRAGFQGNDIVLLAAIRGTVVSSAPGAATANFDAGRFYLTSLAQGTFDPRNPDTWNFAGTFAEFGLVPPESVVPGSGQALAFSASVMNQSSVNTTSSNQADGRFLFMEDSTAAQNALPGSGDDWLTVTSQPQQFVTDEGFLVQSFQTVEFADLSELSGDPLTASDLAVMDAIYTDMATKAGLGPLVFATGFGGAADSDFNPQFGPGVTGDFRGELQLRNSIVAQVIPEPGSLALLSIGVALGAFGGFRRRRRDADSN